MTEEPRLSASAMAALAKTGTTQPAPKLELAPAPDHAPETEPDELSAEEVRAEIERMIGPGIGGYTVEAHGRKWGPFGTAEEAAQWAVESLPDQLSTMLKHIDWIIRPFLKAELPEAASHCPVNGHEPSNINGPSVSGYSDRRDVT